MTSDEGASNNEILIAACKDDNLDMLEQILSADSSSFDINHTDELGNSALHYAARYGSTGCLEILLYYDGIKVNAINSDEGDTPLHKAAGYQDVESALDMVQILIRGGASPKIKNKLQQTPVDIAAADTHAEVKIFLENAALGTHHDERGASVEDGEVSDGEPGDYE
ncbi:ankyrin repeat-containing domain protein [Gamsiella multidivaricata]|uniref:ankyrin repeat-containing domain protein n=1 Tax=Gamsiella multidivaricata TaxID=101098 RepID=UPI0022202CF0|nr:ankyrin repeat-containing domain protein [Gamsiella multidivaricata]KAI7816002.1 ankyrin repeat-containing domain protein [Gamsiella multidivaricata]